jgi:hypothetical protein
MPPFTMTVTVHEPFRSMAVDVAGKYAEMAGGGPADVEAFAAALAGTLGQVVAGASDADTIDLAFRPNGHGIECTVTCGTHASVVRQPILAKKG